MWDTIRGLVAAGSTILLTTQYLDEADQLASRIAVIDRGRKVAEGTSDELKASVGESTLDLRLADPDDTGAAVRVILSVLGILPARSPEAGRLGVPMRSADEAGDVLIALRQSRIGIAEVSVQKPSLDEVFLALTGHTAEDPERESERGSEHESEREFPSQNADLSRRESENESGQGPGRPSDTQADPTVESVMETLR